LGVATSACVDSTVRHRGWFMRLLSLIAAGTVFVAPASLFAQRPAAPPPTITTPIAVHISPPTSTGIHSFNPSPAHSPVVTSLTGTQAQHAAARTDFKSGAQRSSDNRLSTSAANSQPAKLGLFAFLHRRKHIPVAPTPATSLLQPSATPLALETHVGCRVIPVPNPAIPCNIYSPCCP
jgi:hypothetical protein